MIRFTVFAGSLLGSSALANNAPAGGVFENIAFDSRVENAAFGFLVIGFLVFILYCRYRRLFSEDSFFSLVGKTHARFAVLTTVSFLGWGISQAMAPLSVLTHALTLLLLFFLLHYGFFNLVVGLVKKSVSLNLLLMVNRTPGIPLETLLKNYADGRGIEFLVTSRLEQMKLLGWIDDRSGCWALTPGGIRASKFHRLLKSFFGVESPLEKAGRKAHRNTFEKATL
jgi:hypothetical protein